MRRGDDQFLFCDGDLDATLRAQIARVKELVDDVSRDQFLATSVDVLVDHIYSSMEISALHLHEEAMVMDQEETRVDVSKSHDRNPFRDPGPIYVSGIRVTIIIPFSGDAALWKLRTNCWQSVFPTGIIRPPNADGVGVLEIVLTQPSDENPEKLKQKLDDNLKSIRFYLQNQKQQIEQHNAALPNIIRQAVQVRRDRLQAHDGIAQALNIPLKRREGAPQVHPIPVQRKLVRPLPAPPRGGYKPEPGITDDDYEHILSVVRHEGRTFEATPATFAIHDEEELRDIILAHLNGHYQGGATGETFRRSGKTDVRIEDNNRAAFVAECKVWRGSKELAEAVDQLLSYLTWRDCKAAIVIFNKYNARFSDLLQKVPETLATHPRLRKNLEQRAEGEWRLIFVSAEDEAREVIVHVFLFNLYINEKLARIAVEAVGQGS